MMCVGMKSPPPKKKIMVISYQGNTLYKDFNIYEKGQAPDGEKDLKQILVKPPLNPSTNLDISKKLKHDLPHHDMAKLSLSQPANLQLGAEITLLSQLWGTTIHPPYTHPTTRVVVFWS